MIFNIECPGCKKKYDVHNSFGARQVACDCGAKFTLPAAPPEGDYQVCHACHELCSKDNVICTTCGFNFKTGGKIKAVKKIKDDDDPGFWFKYGILIKKLVILTVLLLVGFLIYHHYTAKAFGISEKAPLGVYQVVNDFLGKLNFECKELPAPAQYTECKMYRFYNAKQAKDSRGMIDESIFLIVNKDGIIQAAIGNYAIPNAALAANGTIVSRFFGRLRDEVGVPEQPDFKSVQHGKGAFGWTENICNWTNQKVRICWSRVDNSQGLVASNHKLALMLANYTQENAFAGSLQDVDEDKAASGEDADENKAAKGEVVEDGGKSSGSNITGNISKGIKKAINKKQTELEIE
jgi:hypothetical protein